VKEEYYLKNQRVDERIIFKINGVGGCGMDPWLRIGTIV
jgi:hypothetical protein